MSESWKWQLRDRSGQWMDMNSEVRWLSRGAFTQGTIIGSRKADEATVREALTGRQLHIPTDRLIAISPVQHGRPPAPVIPKDFSRLSDRQMEDLYAATRQHPDVPVRKWLRVARETHKRKIHVYPHSGGFIPAGVFAAGMPVMPTADAARQMQIRIIEREFNLTTV
jgi:hypothetical protein